MKRFIKISLITLSTLSILPFGILSQLSNEVSAVSQQQNTRSSMMSLGATLNDQQRIQTQTLLGGMEIPPNNILYIDGPTINHYLKDGSTLDTQVFSSTLIQPQAPGYGVQVQILTPQYIQKISQATYQNAAITAGAKDVLVRVATVIPVTGEGALAGVYALLEKSGVKLNPQDITLAEKEIQIINNVENHTINNDININVNQLIANIKIFVINELQDGKNPETNFEQFVRSYLKEIGLTEEQINELLTNPEFLDQLKQLVNEFKESDAAKDPGTAEQLDQSINHDLGRPWGEVLKDLNEDVTIDALQNMEKQDFSSLEHPIFTALQDTLHEYLNQEVDFETMYRLYSHTFVIETMNPIWQPDSIYALNHIRTMAVYYLKAINEEFEMDDLSHLVENYKMMREENPAYASMMEHIAIASGYSPQAYDYVWFSEGEQGYGFDVQRLPQSEYGKTEEAKTFIYSPKDNQTTDLATGEILPKIFDIVGNYGVELEDRFVDYAGMPSISSEESSYIEEEPEEEIKQEDTVSTESNEEFLEESLSEERAEENVMEQESIDTVDSQEMVEPLTETMILWTPQSDQKMEQYINMTYNEAMTKSFEHIDFDQVTFLLEDKEWKIDDLLNESKYYNNQEQNYEETKFVKVNYTQEEQIDLNTNQLNVVAIYQDGDELLLLAVKENRPYILTRVVAPESEMFIFEEISETSENIELMNTFSNVLNNIE